MLCTTLRTRFQAMKNMVFVAKLHVRRYPFHLILLRVQVSLQIVISYDSSVLLWVQRTRLKLSL